MTNPLIVILLLASAVSAAVGEVVNATVIVAMVAMGTALSFVQTYRSQRAASALRALGNNCPAQWCRKPLTGAPAQA